MGKIETYTSALEELVWDPQNAGQLAELLTAESNLPGPRANLELAEAFAQAVSTAAAEPAAWLETLYAWAGISAEEAPTGDPKEFLPFCALLAFGVLYNTHACAYPCTGPCDCPLWPVQSEHLVETIRRSASDSRWRIREAAAMALQRLGEGNPKALRRILDDWLNAGAAKDDSPADGTLTESSSAAVALMERRTVLAALAHPPLLEDPDFSSYALKTGGRILEDAARIPSEQRKGEAFQILKKGLSYALSVFVAHLPAEGFPMLERWAHSSDPDIKRILVENLKKRRLKAANPDRVADLLRMLSG
ncbi:MAG: hypothetical protein JSV89_11360 [Spirochaetaceae bacterium]|nr:MAG: hypothetical protein JSV89_11360 [Spirochaetaceae bacterium]